MYHSCFYVSDAVLINSKIIAQNQHYTSSTQSMMVINFNRSVVEDNVGCIFRGLQHQRQELLHIIFQYIKRTGSAWRTVASLGAGWPGEEGSLKYVFKSMCSWFPSEMVAIFLSGWDVVHHAQRYQMVFHGTTSNGCQFFCRTACWS